MKEKPFHFGKKFLLLLIVCFNTCVIQSQNFQWAKSLGGTLQDEGRSITVDTYGNVYTTGVFQGTVDFDPGAGTFTIAALGNKDAYISKLDPLGNFIWAKSIGGVSAYVEARGIKIDAGGNIYTCGDFYGTVDFDPSAITFSVASTNNNNIYISKLDASGNLLWVKNIGSGGTDMARAIALDANNNVYTTGSFMNVVDFDPGAGTFNLTAPGANKQDIFISKLDASGNFIWAKNMGGSFDDIGYGIAVDINNNVYATGSFSSTADFDPGVGVVSFTAAASTDMFISKLDPLGNYVWAKQFTCANGKGIVVDGNFNVYTTSAFNATVDFDPGPGTYTLATGVIGDADVFVSKLDMSGNFIWAKQLGGTNTGPDDGLAITIDLNNNVYTTGLFSGTGDFDPGPGSYTMTVAGGSSSNSDIFISKLDVSGNFVWAVQMGGTSSNDQGTSMQVTNYGYVYTTGIYVGSGDFDQTTGTYTLSALGITDAFIHKMSTCPLPSPPNNTTNNTNQLICAGNSTTLSASGSGTLSWYAAPNSTVVLNTGTTLVTPTLSAGTYTYYLEAKTCAISDPQTQITVTVSVCTGINKSTNEDQFLIYPNPNNGIINIEIENESYIQVLDVLGKTVLESNLQKGNNTLNILHLSSGIYYFKIQQDGVSVIKKIIKQ